MTVERIAIIENTLMGLTDFSWIEARIMLHELSRIADITLDLNGLSYPELPIIPTLRRKEYDARNYSLGPEKFGVQGQSYGKQSYNSRPRPPENVRTRKLHRIKGVRP